MACFLAAGLPLLFCCARASEPATEQPKPVTLVGYMVDPCGNCAGALAASGCGPCNEYNAMLYDVRELLGAHTDAVDFQLYNVFSDENAYDDMTARFEEFGIERDMRALPIFFTDDGYVTGVSEEELISLIRSNGKKPAQDEASTTPEPERTSAKARRLIYLYVDSCADCGETSAFLNELDGEIEVIRYNIGTLEGLEMSKAIYAHYRIEEERRLVPMVIVDESVLVGKDEIIGSGFAESGAGFSTVVPEVEKTPSGARVAAFIVGGILVCAVVFVWYKRRQG